MIALPFLSHTEQEAGRLESPILRVVTVLARPLFQKMNRSDDPDSHQVCTGSVTQCPEEWPSVIRCRGNAIRRSDYTISCLSGAETLQSTQAGKPRVAHPTIQCLAIHIFRCNAIFGIAFRDEEGPRTQKL